MSLEYAILGFLEVGPKTGYDLKKRFDRSISGFWRADQSRIYRTLAGLRRTGDVACEVVPQSTRPDRKLYRITESGRDRLYAWLEDVDPGAPPRMAWVLQVFFAGLLSDEEAIHLLRRKRERIVSHLAAFPTWYRLSSDYEHDESERVDFFHWLTLDAAVFMRYALIDWIDGAIERIENQDYARGRDAAVTRWPPYDDPRR